MSHLLTHEIGTIFPQGAVHFRFNPTCEPALFVAAIDNNDPGRIQIARNFFSVQPDAVIVAALGNTNTITPKNIDVVRQFVPSQFAVIIGSCARHCGLATGSDELELKCSGGRDWFGDEL